MTEITNANTTYVLQQYVNTDGLKHWKDIFSRTAPLDIAASNAKYFIDEHNRKSLEPTKFRLVRRVVLDYLEQI